MAIEQLAADLRAQGATRARNPVSAVRRALRDDLRVIELEDGRLASLSQALGGVQLTAAVEDEDIAAHGIDVEPDMGLLAALGVGRTLELPVGARVGDLVAVTIDDPVAGLLHVRALASVSRRMDDEAALVRSARAALSASGPNDGRDAPAFTRISTLVLQVCADNPTAFRSAGRPISQVLDSGGFECHLGWVGPRGTDWSHLTEREADRLEREVGRWLISERPEQAAAAQEQLLTLLRHHLPERVPAARRALARSLARAGRVQDAWRALISGGSGDPEDWYEAAVIARRAGDDVRARRWVEAGLARIATAEHADVALCLADLGAAMDGEAALTRARLALIDVEPTPDGRALVADQVATLRRSCLVESLLEGLLESFSDEEADALISGLAAGGERERNACLAFAAVAPHPLAARALELTRPHSTPHSPAVAGLLSARPAAAWSTLAADAPDQRQVIVSIDKEDGRIAPLIVLIDVAELHGAVKEAFFLPDMAPERLRREVIAPMEEFGLRCRPLSVERATEMIMEGLRIAREIGREPASLDGRTTRGRIVRALAR